MSIMYFTFKGAKQNLYILNFKIASYFFEPIDFKNCTHKSLTY